MFIETVNNMALGGNEGYEHIKDLLGKCEKPSVSMLQYILDEPKSTKQGDLLSAFLLGIGTIAQSPGYKKGQGRIIIISDFESPVSGEDQVPIIIDSCNQLGIRLYCFGIEANLSNPHITNPLPLPSSSSSSSSITSSTIASTTNHEEKDDIASPMIHSKLKRLHHPSDIENNNSSSTSSADDHSTNIDTNDDLHKVSSTETSTTLDHNLGLIHHIIDCVREIVGDAGYKSVSDALQLFSEAQIRAVRTVSKFRGTLDIGNSVHIPVWTYAHTAEAKLPSLKKISQSAVSSSLAGNTVNDEESAVSFFRRYKRTDTAQHESDDVPREELLKAYPYGRDLIPVSKIDEDAVLKYTSERQLAVLGIQSANILPRYAFLGSADVVVAGQGEKEVLAASKALSAFARGLAAQNCVAICRYVKRANSAPALVAAIPALAQLDKDNEDEHANTKEEDGEKDPDDTMTQTTGNPLENENILRMHERYRGSGSVLEAHHASSKVPIGPTSLTTTTTLRSASGQDTEDEDDVIKPTKHSRRSTTASHTSTSSSNINYSELPSQRVLENDDINGPAYEHPPLISPFGFDVLYLVPLPYADDVRNFTFDNAFTLQDRYKPNQDQLEAMDNYIDGMDLVAAANAEFYRNPTINDPGYGGFDPLLSFNPLLYRFYKSVMARLINPEAPLPPIPASIQAYTAPVYERAAAIKQANAGIESLHNAFKGTLNVRQDTDILGEQRSVDKRLLSGKRPLHGGRESRLSNTSNYRNTVMNTGDEENGVEDGDIPNKRARTLPSFFGINPSSDTTSSTTTGSTTTTISSTGKGPTSVGTAHPVDDFYALLNKNNPQSIELALSGMMKVIQSLSTNNLHYPKAVQALQALREGALKVVEEEQFNTFLRTLKEEHAAGSGRDSNSVFWREVMNKHITLISTDEAGAGVSPEEAQNFFNPPTAPEPDTAPTVITVQSNRTTLPVTQGNEVDLE